MIDFYGGPGKIAGWPAAGPARRPSSHAGQHRPQAAPGLHNIALLLFGDRIGKGVISHRGSANGNELVMQCLPDAVRAEDLKVPRIS